MEWTSIYQLFWCSPGVQGFDTLPNEKWLKRWTTWLVKDVVSSWFRSVGMFAVKTGRTGTTKSFGRGVAGEVRPVILARICWLPIDEPISPYLIQVWGQGFFLPNPGVGFLPFGDFPQCVCCSREASSWKAIGNCPGQELQETLQGERQKLLDAHEKMKTFQQEAWMVCCRFETQWWGQFLWWFLMLRRQNFLHQKPFDSDSGGRLFQIVATHADVYDYILYIYILYNYISIIHIYIYFSFRHIVAFCCGHHAVQILVRLAHPFAKSAPT